MKKKILTGSILLAFLHTASAITIDKIVALGDSLSDNGNVFATTSSAHKVIPQIPIIPKEPYYQGRFTNGPVWVENLAQTLNVPLVDYAYGGSWAESIIDSNQLFPFDLATQVTHYLTSAATDYHKDQHLYTIWTGNNDYLNQERMDIEYATTNTVNAIAQQIDWLRMNGARNFLLILLPDFGLTPTVKAQGPEYAAKMTKISLLHNAKFTEMIEKMRKKFPNVKFVLLDINPFFKDVMENPEKYHLKNVKDACYTGDYRFAPQLLTTAEVEAARAANIDIQQNISLRTAYLATSANQQQLCDNPDEYLFWDGVHPSRLVHQGLAEHALNRLFANNIYGK